MFINKNYKIFDESDSHNHFQKYFHTKRHRTNFRL